MKKFKIPKLFILNKHKTIFKVPTILQMEAVECGAAALAMIFAYYKKYIPLEKIREKCGVSRDGSKAGNIVKAAKQFGLTAKGYKLEIEDLQHFKLPMIIHWNLNHFVVLEGYKKDYFYINDPAIGQRKISKKEFDMSFTGIALTFEPGEDFKESKNQSHIFNIIIKKFKGNTSSLLFIILAGLALSIPNIVLPIYSKIFIDEILLAGSNNLLTPLIFAMIFTSLVLAWLMLLKGHFLLRFETKMSLNSSSNFFWRVLKLPIEFFNQRYKGDICSRIESNISVANFISEKIPLLIVNIIILLFCLILMIKYDTILTLITVFTAILNISFMQYISRKRINQSIRLSNERAKLLATSMSGLQNIETLKATGSEGDFFETWTGFHAKVVNVEQDLNVYSHGLDNITTFLTMFASISILLIGSYRVIGENITVGTLIAFQLLMQIFLGLVNDIVNLGKSTQEIFADVKRLEDINSYPLSEIPLSEDISEVDKLKGYVEIKDLTYGYNHLESPLIENFNLKLTPGNRVALVGSSGSGKSTILKLISGLYSPWSGEILLDGKSTLEISRIVVSNSLSMVSQEISVFEGSIRDNITLWDDTVFESDIIKAAKDAYIHDDITSRSNGYEEIIEEGGRNFSGGQLQRIEIARALVQNPSILIMDEATSALDTKVEKIIDDNIRKRGCTCLIVAHRLSTIRDADEIIVLEQGKIVQRGTHEQMKDIDGPYSRLIADM